MRLQIQRVDKINSYTFLAVLLVVAGILSVQAQQPPVAPAPKKVAQDSTRAKIVELRQADEWSKRKDFDAQILKNNVVFYHEGAFMYCDSAYMYEATNSFEAFSNVRMEQGDTLFVYGDYLHYDGNTRLARLRDNVRMEDPTATLFTDSLNYDRMANLGYYFDGGMLVDDENELTSFWGQYNPDSKQSLFSDSVKLVNEQYIIYADTLKYNTMTKIADILGPSTIVSDSGYINTQKGWYNTVTNDSWLLDRSEVHSNDTTKVLIGDTIFYNRDTEVGEVFGNMFLHDIKRKMILRGDYGYYEGKTEYALATDSAFAIEYSQNDSLYLHGDTLILQTDSVNRNLKAYYDVRFFRSDLQGVCDSMQYISTDSILYMYGDPVIWNQGNQILGNQINIHLNDSTIDKALIKDFALAIQERNVEGQYNQLTGRDMTVLFRDNNPYHILVEGNAESLYYLLEEDSTIVGLNRTESAFLSIDIEKNKIKKLKLWSSTNATTTPLPKLSPGEDRLKGFVWLHYLRPSGPTDIFRKNERSAADNAVTLPRRYRREEEL